MTVHNQLNIVNHADNNVDIDMEYTFEPEGEEDDSVDEENDDHVIIINDEDD